MKEYEGIDAVLYDTYIFGQMAEQDIAFYVDEAKQSEGPALELGCGTGRITIPVAESGVEIVGLDRSNAMLEIARKKISGLSDNVRSRITLVEDDMLSFSLDRSFNLIIIPFRAFLHLLTVDEQKTSLTGIRDHLSPNGRLIFNIFDPNLDIIAAHRSYLGEALKKQTEFKHPATGNQVIGWDSRKYYLDRQLIDELRLYEEVDEAGCVVSRYYVPLKLRYIYRYEMQHLLEICGFKAEALFGDFDRGPFRAGGEQIWICSKL